MRRWAAIFLIFLLASCGWQEGFGQVSSAPVFTPSQPSRPTSPSDRLADPNRSARAKIEAAQVLLAGSDEQAIGVLKDFLSHNDNHSAQAAIAEAVAESQDEHKELFEPLLAVLLDGDPTVKAPIARALVRLADDRMLDRLLAVAHDRKASPSGRLELVRAFHLVPDWRVLDTLVVLTDDGDAQIRQAAANSLARLTNITDFADDPSQWKQWWEVEKKRDRTALLADIAVRQARRRASLETDNARLRERLGAALSDLYAASPPAQRQMILLGFLKDSLAEVRLGGLQLADRRLAASEEISGEIRQEAKDLLADADSRVRQEAAIVVANLADGDALTCLLDRLKVENSPLVRCSLMQALGQLRQAQALPAVLAEVDSKHPDVAAAAAAALARIAGAVELGEARRTAAAEAVVSRYRQVRQPDDEADLREALLSAMGVVGDASLSPLLQEALLDKNAKVRLAAAISLGKVGKADAADSLAALTTDGDRGVRQAALAALGPLGGQQHLSTVLNMTNPALESDDGIRQQAWEVAMTILKRSDNDTLATVADSLAGRSDALAERIKILQMLADRMSASGDGQLCRVQRLLGSALMVAGRPAEAAIQLSGAYVGYQAVGNADCNAVWLEWVDAMLVADDLGCLTAMGEQSDGFLFARAVSRLFSRLAELGAKGEYRTVILLATEAFVRLPHRLSSRQRANLDGIIRDAKARQLAADRETIRKLLPALNGGDDAARKAAVETVQAMSDGAVLPLMFELRSVVASPQVDRTAETAIVEMLRLVSPRLGDYDVSAPTAKKLALIDEWIRRNSD